MADPPATKKSGGMGFLTRKVGPLPIWAYGLIIFGAYYWYTHYGPGAKPAAAPAAPRPQIIVVTPKEPRQVRQGGGPGPEPGPPPRSHRQPRRDRDRTRPPIRRKPPVPVGTAGTAAPGTQPGQVDTSQSPVYDAWTADAGAVPDPQQAYAPMTAGSIYG